MADKKITQLTNITGANLVDADEFVVVDISADETKAITLGELKEAFDSGSGFVRITGDTMTGDLALSGADVTFGDNDKAIFGAGSDLQIYHDGLNSWIKDTGTGNLKISAGNFEAVGAADTNKAFLYGIEGGSLYLYHNGNAKLQTTSSGIDVTGTAVTDGLTVAGNVSVDGGTIKLDGNYPVGTGNVALGDAALDSNVSGAQNTAIGSDALTANTADDNTAVGWSAMSSNTTGSLNVAVGRSALAANNTGGSNTAVGYAPLSNNTTGGSNVAVGRQALLSNTTASSNTAVGYQSLYSNVTGGNNTGLGNFALRLSTGENNTAVGHYAAYGNTTGSRVIAVGGGTLNATNTGSFLVAMGHSALSANTSGGYNVAVGDFALQANTTASYNTAVGYQAGFTQTTGHTNTNVGVKAGYGTTTGIDNTYIGPYAGIYMTTGSKNVIIGRHSGNFGGLDIRTSSNNIVLSDGDGNPRVFVDSSGNVNLTPNQIGSSENTNAGVSLTPTGTLASARDSAYANLYINKVGLSGEMIRFTANGSDVGSIDTTASATSYNTSSDYRLKENVVAMTGATDRLKQLNPSRFNFIADDTTAVDGFLAHEVQSVVPEAVTGTKDAVDTDGNPVYQGIDQSKLVPLLVATIQELEARITALENA